MMCSCVLSKVNAQQYQMEALDPEKNSNVIFYNDPKTDTLSMSLKNVARVQAFRNFLYSKISEWEF